MLTPMRLFAFLPLLLLAGASAFGAAAPVVRTASGKVAGEKSASGIAVFRGIPFAAPPVGPLRWKAPQPVTPWKGVRAATAFGARCMQARIFDDMIFRDPGPSEDCLTLNVWTPEAKRGAKLPVMVWIYGGGFTAGGSSEPRQDGENLAKKGVVVVSMNYRLNVFGFFAHPALAEESDRKSAGNYGLMDQLAALQWVKRNIARFGGDPNQVTIFGESAGSFSVSAQMASPLAQGLFHRAIGESGSYLGEGPLPMKTAAQAGQADLKFATGLGKATLAELRAMPADEILKAAMKPGMTRFVPVVDGYFLTDTVPKIFQAGQQSHVPLLAGWNAQEGFLMGPKPTPASFADRARQQFGARAEELLRLYPASTPEETLRSALDLSGDQFIAYSTWKWGEAHLATGKSPVYRYRFDQAPPPPAGSADAGRGAYHSAEIEFVFGALASKNLPWRPEDHKVSELMTSYWSNFAKRGDPNGPGLPKWPAFGGANGEVMQFLNGAQTMPEPHRARYEFLDQGGRP